MATFDQRHQTVTTQYNINIEAEKSYSVEGLKNPYLGLRAYTYKDHAHYAGREASISKAVEQLAEPGDKKSLFFIIGSSGSGKSSFAQAGLLPALEQYYYKGNQFKTIRHGLFVPAKFPIARFATALSELGLDAEGPFSIAKEFIHMPPIERAKEGQLSLLIIDQFEELFTQSDDKQRDSFLNFLYTLPPFKKLNMHIIATLRVDYLPYLFNRYPNLWTSERSIELQAMTVSELKEAITKPLDNPEYSHVRFDPALLDQLAQDAAQDATHLPLLQVALENLWERGKLKLSEYHGLADAIQRRVGEVLAKMSSHEDEIMQIMLDLVDVSLGDNQRYWRLRRSIQDIVVGYPDRKRLIDQLVNERLLSTSSNTGEGDADEPATVTIIHEALIENWDKLREQIVEKQEVFRQRTRFRDACNEWKKRIDIKQDESRLVNESTIRNLLSIFQNLTSIMSFIDPKKEILHSDFLLTGIRLEEAKALNTKHDIELQSDRARKFLKASIDEAGKVERRRKQIREVIAGGAMLIAIAAVVITILTLYARDRERIAKVNAQRAEQNALIGESGVLAAEAQQQIIENPVLAVNYSLQALPNSENKPRPYVSAAEFSLTQALRTIQERAYYKLSQTPLTESQVAAIHQAGTDSAQIAIGGDGLHLFLGATTSPITLTTSVSIVYGIAWGDADHLLVYGKHGIEVWEDTGRTTDHSFVRIEESQLDEPIACAAWQPNVQAIAICSGSDIAIWSAPWTNEPIVIRTGFYGFVIGARWSPDAGSHLAAYDDYGGLLYLEASNPGRAVLIPEAHDFEITDLTWSANHRYLVTAFYDGTVNIWDTTSNEAPLSIAVCEGYTGVDFVSDAQFVTWSSRGSLRQWTVDGEPVYGQNGGSDCIDDATAPTTENLIELENGNLLITRSNGSAEIRGAIERPGYVIAGHERAVVAATLSPNGQYLATGSQDGTVRIWDTQNQTLITTLRRHDGVRQDERRADVLAVQWLDNHTLVSVGEDGTLRRWAVFGDDGVAICLGETGDGFPRCVDPNSIITGRTGLVADARWLGSAKEEYLLGSVSLRDRTARLWESPSSQSVTDALILQNVITYTLAESITSAFWLDAERLLLSESSGTARLVDPQTGADIQNPVNHDSAITQIAFANGRLTTGDSTGHVYMWTADLSSVQIVHRFEQAVESLEWSGSNAYLLASGGDVVLLNTAESSLTWSWPNAGEKTYASLSPDASFVAIAFDKMLMVIERSTNQVKQRREGFTEPIQGVQWVTGEPWPHQPEDFLDLTPETDSRTSLILVWSGDGSAHLWNWQAGQDIMQLSEHPLRTGEDLPIVQASVSQDGAYILTLSESFVDAFYNEQSIMRLWRSWHNNPAALLKKASNMRTVSQE